MDYITWVNNNKEQSARYMLILVSISEQQTELTDHLQRLESAQKGVLHSSSDDGIFGKFGLEKLTNSFVDAAFRMSLRNIGMSEGEIYLREKLQNEQREQERVKQRIESEIVYCRQQIEDISASIEKKRLTLKELERSEVLRWQILPEADWDRELTYRVLDLRKIPSQWSLDGSDLNSLFGIIEYLREEYDVEFTIKNSGGSIRWIFTMSYEGHHYPRISVTRVDFDPAPLIRRTALTFLDLAWQQLTEVCKEGSPEYVHYDRETGNA